jgi:hypothetical protein
MILSYEHGYVQGIHSIYNIELVGCVDKLAACSVNARGGKILFTAH